MAVRTKEELLQNLQGILGENTSDEALALIEDATDTLADFETRTVGQDDWKSKYEENDAMWRKKYKDRFFNPNKKDEEEEDDEPKKKPRTFDELFK